MQIELTMSVAQLYAIEMEAKVPPRSIDMARCVKESVEACDETIKLVLFERPGDGWVGYSSPFNADPPRFNNNTASIKQRGDRLNDKLVAALVLTITARPDSNGLNLSQAWRRCTDPPDDSITVLVASSYDENHLDWWPGYCEAGVWFTADTHAVIDAPVFWCEPNIPAEVAS